MTRCSLVVVVGLLALVLCTVFAFAQFPSVGGVQLPSGVQGIEGVAELAGIETGGGR